MARDFYEVLGVAKDVNEDALKKAYRKLAMKYHPDRNQGDKGAEKSFREVSDAYEVLKDPQKKAAYDRYGHAAFDQNAGGPNAAGGFKNANDFSGFNFGGGNFNGSFADMIDEMFGGGLNGGGGAPGQAAGTDIRFNQILTLEEAFKGSLKNINFATLVGCESCKGSGGENGARPTTCNSCHGRGKTRMQQGFFTIEKSCAICGGSGQVISIPCRPCNSSGRSRQNKKLEVKIPAGVEEGTRIRVTKEGEAGLRGAPAGDLYVFLTIEAHPLFKRQGNDLLCKVPLSITTAALGGSIEVPTIDGKEASLKIPVGTQTNQLFRLKSKGMSMLRSTGRGDMIVEITLETPQNLSKEQKDVLQKFNDLQNDKNYPATASFVKKVKDFFSKIKN